MELKTDEQTLLIDQQRIAPLISELRSLTGLTQAQLAARLGFSWGTINRWENGRNNPSPIAIHQIERFLLNLGDRGQNLLAKYSTSQIL